MFKNNFCPECGEKIQENWKFCMTCGNLLANTEISNSSIQKSNSIMNEYSDQSSSSNVIEPMKKREVDAGVIAGVSILVAILVFVGIIFSNKVDPNDFVKRLNKVSEFNWEEDPLASLATSDRFRALRGFFGDNCNVYIYETEKKALDTAKNYLTPKMYWWGTDDQTGYGVVIADQGTDSPCTDQAAEAFGWTLEH